MARPLKVADSRFLLRPLNVIFGAPSHIAILRALHGSSRGLTGREVARAAGIAQRAAMEGLERLERAHLVRRTPAGRAYLFELDRDIALLKEGILPLLEREGTTRAEVFARLRKAFENSVVSGSVYGSAARGEDRPESDLDVFLVVERVGDKDKVAEVSSRLFEELRKNLGVLASFAVYTRPEFTRRYREGQTYFRNVVREAERFAGRSPKDLIDDEKDKARRR